MNFLNRVKLPSTREKNSYGFHLFYSRNLSAEIFHHERVSRNFLRLFSRNIRQEINYFPFPGFSVIFYSFIYCFQQHVYRASLMQQQLNQN